MFNLHLVRLFFVSVIALESLFEAVAGENFQIISDTPVVLRSTDLPDKFRDTLFAKIARVQFGYWRAATWQEARQFILPGDEMLENSAVKKMIEERRVGELKASRILWNMVRLKDADGWFCIGQATMRNSDLPGPDHQVLENEDPERSPPITAEEKARPLAKRSLYYMPAWWRERDGDWYYSMKRLPPELLVIVQHSLRVEFISNIQEYSVRLNAASTSPSGTTPEANKK